MSVVFEQHRIITFYNGWHLQFSVDLENSLNKSQTTDMWYVKQPATSNKNIYPQQRIQIFIEMGSTVLSHKSDIFKQLNRYFQVATLRWVIYNTILSRLMLSTIWTPQLLMFELPRYFAWSRRKFPISQNCDLYYTYFDKFGLTIV